MTNALSIAATTTLVIFIFLVTNTWGHPAWGIAVDHQGQVYFSDLKSVWKIDAQGKLSIFRSATDTHTHDLNLDEAGNLYGAENSYEPQTQRFFSAVWKKSPTGGSSYLLPSTNAPPKGTSIWKDRAGNMYHVTYYPANELLVLKKTPDGHIIPLVGSGRAAREYRQSVPYSAGGMSFGVDGALYFTHGTNVSKVTPSGTLTALARNVTVENSAGEPGGGGSSLFGIAVDAQGNTLVADYGNRRILKIDPHGDKTTVIRSDESWFPTGVSIKDDRIYILEERHTPSHQPLGVRVRKLLPDGTVTVLATVGEETVSSRGIPAAETSSGVSSERRIESRHNISYVLIGTGLGVFLLAIFAWLVKRSIYDRQDGNI